MKKSESIYRLEETGLNTLNYFITKSNSEALHYLAKHDKDLLSLRTEKGNDFNCPYYYSFKGEDLWEIAKKRLSEGYTLIFAQSIDIKDCEAFGTIGLGENNPDVIEVVFGQGKVRDLDNHPDRKTIVLSKGRMKAILSGEHGLTDERIILLNTIFKRVKDSLYDSIPCIVEWSYYNKGVGRLGTRDIYWEVRENV